MSELDRVCEVKRSARWALLALPGVHGVGVGTKIVGGQRGEQLAIVVFVSKKKPRQLLLPAELVPTEIEGVPTDVVEASPLQLTANGGPAAPQLTAESAGPNVIQLSGSPVPGSGWVVSATVTVASSGITTTYTITFETRDGATIAAIGQQLASQIQKVTGIPATFSSSSQQVTLTPPGGATLNIAPLVNSTDSTPYTPLVGGIQVNCGPVNIDEYGTLGCILIDDSTPPQAYGLTCYHVVADWGHTATQGRITLAPFVSAPNPAAGQAADVRFMTIGNATNLPSTVTTLSLTLNSQAPYEIVSLYTASDPPSSTDVEDAITAVGNAVNSSGLAVTGTITPGVLTIAPKNPSDTLFVKAGATNADPSTLRQDRLASLWATVNGTTVTFAGSVDGDNYGVYTMLYIGGRVPTYGIFTPLQNGQALADVASNVALSIQGLTADIQNQYQANVTANPAGNGFTVSGVMFVQCNVSHDVRAGQPGGFPGAVIPVSGPGLRGYIGKVVSARYDVDAALIQLNPGVTYDASVAGISGNLAGEADPSLNQSVKKRGRTTLVSRGTVTGVDVDFFFVDPDSGTMPHLIFGVFAVEPTPPGPFGLAGDSGSAVLANGGADDNKVVGLLIAANPSGTTVLAVPFSRVTQALLPTFLQVATSGGTAPPAPTGP